MFEDLREKLQGFGFTALKKTGEVAEIASMKTKVIAKKKNILEAYNKLGKAFYEAHKEEPGEFSEDIEMIKNLYKEIETMEQDIQKLKDKLPESMKKDAEATEGEAETCAFSDIVGEVAEEFEDIASGVSGAFENMAEEAGEVLEAAAGELTKVVEDVCDSFADKAEDASEAVSKKAEDVTKAVAEEVEKKME